MNHCAAGKRRNGVGLLSSTNDNAHDKRRRFVCRCDIEKPTGISSAEREVANEGERSEVRSLSENAIVRRECSLGFAILGENLRNIQHNGRVISAIVAEILACELVDVSSVSETLLDGIARKRNRIAGIILILDSRKVRSDSGFHGISSKDQAGEISSTDGTLNDLRLDVDVFTNGDSHSYHPFLLDWHHIGLDRLDLMFVGC